MTIIKTQTSADGYECRFVRHPIRTGSRWEVLYDGEWLSLAQLAAILPNVTEAAMRHRLATGAALAKQSMRSVQATPIRLWGRSAIPSEWAKGWAESKGVTLTRDMRHRFMRSLMDRMELRPQDPSWALVRTLQNFTCLRQKDSPTVSIDDRSSREPT